MSTGNHRPTLTQTGLSGTARINKRGKHYDVICFFIKTSDANLGRRKGPTASTTIGFTGRPAVSALVLDALLCDRVEGLRKPTHLLR
jgi:hypothetical protein